MSARLASAGQYGFRTPSIYEFAASDHSDRVCANEWPSGARGGQRRRPRSFAFAYLQAETLSLEVDKESGAVLTDKVVTSDHASAAHLSRVQFLLAWHLFGLFRGATDEKQDEGRERGNDASVHSCTVFRRQDPHSFAPIRSAKLREHVSAPRQRDKPFSPLHATEHIAAVPIQPSDKNDRLTDVMG